MLALALGAAVLFTHAPREAGPYPPCLIHRSTGLFCAGCGSTRAMHALLHGRVWAAFRYNALMVVAVPVVAVAFVRYTRRVFAHPAPRPRRIPPTWCVAALLVLLIAYTVLRNLPVRPLNWLAPTDVEATRSQDH